jgi:hypothetical protein
VGLSKEEAMEEPLTLKGHQAVRRAAEEVLGRLRRRQQAGEEGLGERMELVREKLVKYDLLLSHPIRKKAADTSSASEGEVVLKEKEFQSKRKRKRSSSNRSRSGGRSGKKEEQE